MRFRFFSQLLLCAAAVLFLPQSLDCCRHSESVLGALADTTAMGGMSHSGHSAEPDMTSSPIVHQMHVVWRTMSLCVAELSPDPADAPSQVTSADMHGASQVPGQGAEYAVRRLLTDPHASHRLPIASSLVLTGRSLAPDVPPPQAA